MRTLLILLLSCSVLLAQGKKVPAKIFELSPPGQAGLAELPGLIEAAMGRFYTMDLPPPVHRLSDLAFLPPDRKERLDLYVQHGRDLKVRQPGVLFIHGGGFTGGDKAEYRSSSVSADLARAGYVVVSCNYALGPKSDPVVWPRNIADCRAAVRWMRANADLLGLDAGRIAVAGGSAGGYLALMVGLSDDRTGPGGDPASRHSAKVSAVIDMYGVTDFSKHGRGEVPGVPSERQKDYLPVHQAGAGDPPVLILHGTADTTVALEQSEVMARALAAAGVDHELVVVEGAPHTFDLHPKGASWRRTGVVGGRPVASSSTTADIAEATLDFLARTIGRPAR
ncbi:MAG: alpha/beta hydrolase [Opitutales bacterium]